jgi:salicylate hydroxylase
MPIDNQLKIAIIGAGPGGLAAWINFRRQSGVVIDIYDAATELKEVGAVSCCANLDTLRRY